MGCGGSVAKAAVETDVNQVVADKSEELEEEVQDGLRFLQAFDPQKTGFLPRETIATILQLCSSLSEEEVQERMKDLPSNSQGLEYHHIIPFIELEATYDLEDPKHLAKYLLDAGVRLVRAPYLYKLISANRCMPRRQEAEHDCCEVNGKEVSALVSHEEVAEWAVGRRKALICSVSHAWETREHPDPCNCQLENLVNCVSLWDAAYHDDIWIFYDYLSLFQFQRDTAEQEACFRRAMSNMHVMYAHQSTLTFRLECLTPVETWTARKEDSTYKVPVYHLPSSSIAWIPLSELVENFVFYLERGWCRAEIEWSAARGIPAQNIAIDGEPGKQVTVKIVPTAPEVFEERMATSAFTHRNDASTVVELQSKIFHQKVVLRNHLNLDYLTQADMAELAASLPHFENIKVLNIKRFQAGEVEAKAFFEALGSIPLQKLCMSSAVHAEATGQAMVKALQLDVAAFAALTELDFSYCRMDHGLGEVIAEVLKTNRTLTYIDLSWNTVTDVGVQVIAESLKTNRTLTYIDLSWNKVTDVGVQVIAESLKTNRTLTYIDLSWNRVTDVGVQALANALSVNNVLTHLDLNGNKCSTVVGKQALHEIEDLLQVNRGAAEAPATTPAKQEQDAGDCADAFPGHPRIQELARQLKKGGDMNEIFFDGSDETLGDDETFGDDEVKVLVETLKVNRSVSSIYLAQAGITDTGVKAIAEMLMHNNRITRINLDHNKIGDSGVEALAEVLKHNRSIIHIYLRWNDIGEVGAKALAEAVQENDVILHIGLDPAEPGQRCEDAMRRIDQRCEANQEAKATATVEKLVQELKTDGAKKEIDLQGQYIGDAQVQALAEALKMNESITHIDLSHNPIKDAGAQALAELLKVNRSIEHINLLANQVNEVGAKALAEVLKHNRSITNIDLRYNHIGEVGAEALAEAVQENDAILEIALRGNPLTDGTGPKALERIQERCEANQAAAEARAPSAG